MMHAELLVKLNEKIAKMVHKSAPALINKVDHGLFKKYLTDHSDHMETVITFHAMCVFLERNTEREMQAMLLAQVQALVSGFITHYVQPLGVAYTQSFMKLMTVDDTFTVFSTNVVECAESIAAELKKHGSNA